MTFRTFHFLVIVLLSVVASAAAANEATPAEWPREGEIRYDVMRGEGGVKLGEAVHTWEHDGRRYDMRTTVETTGLAGLLYSFRYVQRSEGVVHEDGLRPTSFRVEQNGREPENAAFDWTKREVLITRSKGRKTTAALSPGDQDVLSVWHLVGLRDGKDLPTELTLVTNRKAAVATMEVVGREVLQLPMGALDTLHVRLRADESSLAIDLWLSERHRLLPVRILMEDGKGEVLDQQAVAIALGAAQTIKPSAQDNQRSK